MSDDIDNIKRELEEVRRLKEELKREVEDAKREKERLSKKRDESRSYHASPREPRPLRPVRPPRAVRPVKIDLSGITDSLEDMMDDLGKSIEMSIKDIDGMREGFRIPGVHIRTSSQKGKAARKRDIENIPPERIAQIVAPLGSEERLRILDFLKTGGKSFNDIENFTGKTGSSLTHHLNPLLDAGYVVKGEVRGTYYVTVEGRLAYRLAQWLTHRVEQQREHTGKNGEGKVDVEFEDSSSEDDAEETEEVDLEAAAEHLERVADHIENVQDKIESVADLIEEAQDAQEEEDDDDDDDDEEDDDDDIDDFDWED